MYTACLFNRTLFLSICTYIQLTAFCKVRRLGRRFDGDVVAIALCMFLNISACAEDICMIFLNSVLQMCCWKYRNIVRSESCTQQQQQQQQQPKVKRQRKGANMQPKGNQREPKGSGKGKQKSKSMDTIGALTVSSGVCTISRHQSVPPIKLLMYFGAFSYIFWKQIWFLDHFWITFLMIFHHLALFFRAWFLCRFFIKIRRGFDLIFDVFLIPLPFAHATF